MSAEFKGYCPEVFGCAFGKVRLHPVSVEQAVEEDDGVAVTAFFKEESVASKRKRRHALSAIPSQHVQAFSILDGV